MGSKKIVLKLDLHDDKDKQKAMKVVSKIPRIDSIAMDMKGLKLTVIGDIDPITLVNKLRKFWTTDIASVGPAKEPEKKKDGGGDGKDGGGGGDTNKNKDGNSKKDGGGGGGGDNKNKKKEHPDPIPAYNPYVMPYNPYVVTYNPHMNYSQQQQHHVSSYYPPPPPLQPPMPAPYGYVQEDNPSSCVIC